MSGREGARLEPPLRLQGRAAPFGALLGLLAGLFLPAPVAAQDSEAPDPIAAVATRVAELDRARVETRSGTYVVTSPRLLDGRLAFERTEDSSGGSAVPGSGIPLEDIRVVERPLPGAYTWYAALIGTTLGFAYGKWAYSSEQEKYNDCRVVSDYCGSPPDEDIFDVVTYVSTAAGGVAGYMAGRRWLRWQVVFRRP